MILEESYRGYKVHVWTMGNGPYRWCYTIDEADYTESHEESFESEQDALAEGLKAAHVWLDQWIAGPP